MDANSLLTPAWRSELQFQFSLLRLMYPKTGLAPGASAQMAELEQLQESTQGVSAAL
jgi:hypothetical protein